MTGSATLDWTQANQQLLAAELSRLKRRLEVDGEPHAEDEGDGEAVARAVAALPAPAAIDVLARLFDLSRFERELLLVCAGVEMDARLAALCGRIHGHDGRRYATFGLALAVLPDAHWSALTPTGPLRRWRLIEVDPAPRLVDSPLRIDERILHLLAGINLLDARVAPLLAQREAPTLMASAHSDLVNRLISTWTRSQATPPVIHLTGDDSAGQEDVAA